jgi:hypothetical protein
MTQGRPPPYPEAPLAAYVDRFALPFYQVCTFGKHSLPICTFGKVMSSSARNMPSTNSTSQARRRHRYASSRGKVIRKGSHSPEAVLRGVLGRTYPEEVLSRALYATQFTRHLDRQGYLRFKHWRFFGENGLAGEEVSLWVYEDTLKVEHQATTLSLTEVTNARRLETHFRSPQLDLWQLSETEWLLALRRPEPVARKKPRNIIPFARQLPLPDFGATG